MSYGKFDRWENTSGTPFGVVLQTAYTFSGIQQRWDTGSSSMENYVDAASENRGRVYWTPEGFKLAIKPRFATSKILLMGHASVCAGTQDSYNIHGRIVRNGTPVGNGVTAQGNHTWAAHCELRLHAANDYASNERLQYQFLDTPGTIDVLHYEFQICHTYSSNYTTYVNRERDTSWESSTSSHFYAMEIQA